jgi:hypothetical protein
MNRFADDSFDELLQKPLTEETFEQLLQICEEIQRANPEPAGGTPLLCNRSTMDDQTDVDGQADCLGGEQNMKRLFVSNISAKTQKHELRELLEPFGKVSGIRIVKDPDAAGPRGFAFVEVANDAEATKALASLKRQKLGGRLSRSRIVF